MTTPVRDLFGIDTGSLAVFRIALGLAILADLLIRAPDLGALYTEEGVLPRSLLDEQVLNLVPHLMFDGALGQGLLFAVEGIVALLLAAGWRTRWVTIASWALLMSLQARNPAVRNGGDETFRLLLFWSMFLPLGASWSVDAKRRTAQRRRASLPAALPAALLLQVALIYPFNALYKDGAAWTSDFTALELFLGNARWSAAWSAALLQHPALLKAMTAAVLGLSVRLAAGVLPPVARPGAHPRRPPVRRLPRRHPGPFADRLLRSGRHRSLDGVPARLVLGDGRRRGRPPRPAGRRSRPAAGAEVGGLRRAGARRLRLLPERDRLTELFGRPVPALLRGPALVLQIDQQWSMFSPEPARRSRFLVAGGKTVGGEMVDLLVDGEPRGAGAPLPPPSGRFGRDR